MRMQSWIAVGVMLLAFAAIAGAADDKPEAVAAVAWDKLLTALPETVEGMEVSEPDGGTMSMADPTNPGSQFSYSAVARTYTTEAKKGKDIKIVLHITDTGFNQLLMTPFLMAFEFDSPDGSVKSVQVAGQPAKRIEDKEKGKTTDVKFLILVGGRLLVMAEGNEAATGEDIEKLINMIDFAALTAMVK